jgi:outer membrane protein assembly factor BamA
MISWKEITRMRPAGSFLPLILPLLAILLITAAPGPPALAEPADADTADGGDRTAEGRNGWIFFPYIFYTPETRVGVGGGGGYFFRNPCSCDESRPSTVLGNVIYTQNKQLVLAVQPSIYWRDEKYYLRTELSYQKFPDKFYGIGNDTDEDAEEDFTPENFQIILKTQVRLLPGLYLGPLVEFSDSRLKKVTEGGLLASGKIRGSEGGQASGVGMEINRDTRDNVYYPSTGGYYQLSAIFFSAVLGSDYEFKRYILDLRQYLPVTAAHVLALQFYGRSTNREVPFQLLSKLGGTYQMRGYYEGRYRDQDMIVLQGEYRLPLWRRFGLVCFAGVGDVACKTSAFHARDFKSSAGLGIRYLLEPEEKLNLRFDFGFGKDTSGFYVNFTEAF